MNKKIYKRLMIAGLLPWRSDVLKKPYRKPSDEDRLLRDGWSYINSEKFLEWKRERWTLLYKVIDEKPRLLAGWEEVDRDFPYRYIEFMAINERDRRAELYSYGNFIKGLNSPYILRGKQYIRCR